MARSPLLIQTQHRHCVWHSVKEPCHHRLISEAQHHWQGRRNLRQAQGLEEAPHVVLGSAEQFSTNLAQRHLNMTSCKVSSEPKHLHCPRIASERERSLPSPVTSRKQNQPPFCWTTESSTGKSMTGSRHDVRSIEGLLHLRRMPCRTLH